MVSYQKGPTCHAYAWQIGPFWQDTLQVRRDHYCDGIMGAMASQITSLTIVYLTIHAGADQRKHQSSAPLSMEFTGERWIPRTDGQ